MATMGQIEFLKAVLDCGNDCFVSEAGRKMNPPLSADEAERVAASLSVDDEGNGLLYLPYGQNGNESRCNVTDEGKELVSRVEREAKELMDRVDDSIKSISIRMKAEDFDLPDVAKIRELANWKPDLPDFRKELDNFPDPFERMKQEAAEEDRRREEMFRTASLVREQFQAMNRDPKPLPVHVTNTTPIPTHAPEPKKTWKGWIVTMTFVLGGWIVIDIVKPSITEPAKEWLSGKVRKIFNGR